MQMRDAAIFGEPAPLGIVALSLDVSLSAVTLATLLGLPLGAAIAVGALSGPARDRSCCSTR